MDNLFKWVRKYIIFNSIEKYTQNHFSSYYKGEIWLLTNCVMRGKKHLRILIMLAIRKPPQKNDFHKNLKEIEESFGIFENFFFF